MFLPLILGVHLALSATAPTTQTMTDAELARTGVSRLSTEERQALDAWIAERIANDGATALPTANAPEIVRQLDAPQRDALRVALAADSTRVGLPGYQGKRTTINGLLVGDIYNFTGRTRVTLDNGQVWEQSESGTFAMSGNDRRVVIHPKLMGSWLLVIGQNRGVRVRRIQ